MTSLIVMDCRTMINSRALWQCWKYGIALMGLALLSSGCSMSQPAVRPTGTPITVVSAATVIPDPPDDIRPVSTSLPDVVPSASITPALTPTTAEATLTPTNISLSKRQQILAEVWTTINDNYLYADFRGLDWSAVREEYVPFVEQSSSDEAFYRLLDTMVQRLNDNHSRVLAPSAAKREDVLSSGRDEQVGIGAITLPLADSLLIQHVFPDSPADRAGLRARDRIVAVDGTFYSQANIQGPAGSKVRLTVVRPGEASRDMVITRRLVEGRITPNWRILPGQVGYLEITTLWVNDMADLAAQALDAMSQRGHLNGLIIDLRHNPGGWRAVLTSLLGHFVRGHVGDFFNRQGDTPLKISDGVTPNLRGVPLAVLIDNGTASYAELLAGILQREAGAIVIGTPSAGNTETIYSYDLTGGARLWVAQEGFRLRDGQNLEGVGVQPDITLTQDWTHYSEDDDPWILEGLRIIREKFGEK
ncbi:MAG: PDZ domain-containing protein [Oscillochloris sp.]|nr:PDZ domain-containing protein [Oscillochloris sp.]